MRATSPPVTAAEVVAQLDDATPDARGLATAQQVLTLLGHSSTGIVATGLELSVDSTTAFSISAGSYRVADPTSDPAAQTLIQVDFAGAAGLTTAFRLTDERTFVSLDGSGSVVLRNGPLTATQRVDECYLGYIVHRAATSHNITGATSEGLPVTSIASQLHQLIEALGPFASTGLLLSASGSRVLGLDITAGQVHRGGLGRATDPRIPHLYDVAAQAPATFKYRTPDAAQGADVLDVVPGSYWNGAAIVAVGGGTKRATIQRVWLIGGAVRVEYGQVVYPTLADAELALATGDDAAVHVSEESLLIEGVLLGYLVMAHTCTSLSNASTARVYPARTTLVSIGRPQPAIAPASQVTVTPVGDDAAGEGFLIPLATITAAIDAVSGDASASTPQAVLVGPGVYVEDVTLPDHVYLIGWGGTATLSGTLTYAGNAKAGLAGITLSKSNGTALVVASAAGTGQLTLRDTTVVTTWTATGDATSARVESGFLRCWPGSEVLLNKTVADSDVNLCAPVHLTGSGEPWCVLQGAFLQVATVDLADTLAGIHSDATGGGHVRGVGVTVSHLLLSGSVHGNLMCGYHADGAVTGWDLVGGAITVRASTSTGTAKLLAGYISDSPSAAKMALYGVAWGGLLLADPATQLLLGAATHANDSLVVQGTVEIDGDDAPTRYTADGASGTLEWAVHTATAFESTSWEVAAVVNVANTGSMLGGNEDVAVTVPGALAGWAAAVEPVEAMPALVVIGGAWVSGTNTVTVRLMRLAGASSGNFDARVVARRTPA